MILVESGCDQAQIKTMREKLVELEELIKLFGLRRNDSCKGFLPNDTKSPNLCSCCKLKAAHLLREQFQPAASRSARLCSSFVLLTFVSHFGGSRAFFLLEKSASARSAGDCPPLPPPEAELACKPSFSNSGGQRCAWTTGLSAISVICAF